MLIVQFNLPTSQMGRGSVEIDYKKIHSMVVTATMSMSTASSMNAQFAVSET